MVVTWNPPQVYPVISQALFGSPYEWVCGLLMLSQQDLAHFRFTKENVLISETLENF